MGKSRQLIFAKHSYALRGDGQFSSQRLVNMYGEAPSDSDDYSPWLLRHSAGLRAVNSFGGPVRALKCVGERLYAAAASKLWLVEFDGSIQELGDIRDDRLTTMTGGGDQILVAADGRGFIYDSTTDDITVNTDFEFGTVDYLDGFAIVNEKNTGRFWVSNLLDFTIYDGLDFASAESRADDLVRVFTDHRELWLFGTKTIEIWYNSGNPDFPFERSQASMIERGTLSPLSVSKMDNTVFWLGEDGIVYRADGYTPARVSTHALERELAAYMKDRNSAEDIRGYVHTEEGHKFYTLRFPDRPAWCYNASTGRWSERSGYGRLDQPWDASCIEPFKGRTFVGGHRDGNLYVLDRDCYHDADKAIPREGVSAPVHYSDNRFITDYVHMDFRCGFQKDIPDPLVLLSKSDDHGATWSAPRERRMGKPGELNRRVTWRGMGSSRNRFYRFQIFEPMAVSLYAAHGRFTMGDA